MKTKLFDLSARGCGYPIEDHPLIGTTEGKLNIHDVIKSGSRCFIVAATNAPKGIAGVRPRMVASRPEPIHAEKNIVCPFCRFEHDHTDFHEMEDEIECNFCGGKFEYERTLTVEHTTRPITGPTIITTTIIDEKGKVLK